MGLCLGFSKSSHVENLDKFKKPVVDKVKLDMIILMKHKHLKEEKMKKNQYSHEFIQNMGLSDPKTCFYQFIFDENDSNYIKIIQYFIMHELGLCIKLNSFVAHIFYLW